jgi:hypothetical protein
MSIKLKDYLKRKRSTLEKLLELKRIKNYQQLLDYCNKRGCEPIDEKEFNLVIKKPILQKPSKDLKMKQAKEELVNEEVSKPEPERRKRRSKVSRSTQNSQEERASNTTVEDT